MGNYVQWDRKYNPLRYLKIITSSYVFPLIGGEGASKLNCTIMKTIYSIALMASLSMTANAQDAYDALDLAVKDLNGTARFVGMGGALSALGGDISVMHSNPAGTGLFRKSEFAVGAGAIVANQGVLTQDRLNIKLDYMGAVFAIPTGDDDLSHINIGIGIKDDRNYFTNLGVNVGGLYLYDRPAFSQTYQIASYANVALEKNSWEGIGTLADISADNPGKHEGILALEEILDNKGNVVGTKYVGRPAQSAEYRRATSGSNTLCDLNLSANIGDKLFLGANLGIHWVNMQRLSEYSEDGIYRDSEGSDFYVNYLFENFYETTGYGSDFKVGMILRPFDDSSFRVGFWYKTPTTYNLTDRNNTTLYYPKGGSYTCESGDYEYKYSDPWAINISLGYTVGSQFAIGAEYEYQDFKNARYESAYYDVLDVVYFRRINEVVRGFAHGQHTFRIGAEFKPVENISVRLGYNYIKSPYSLKGYKEVGFDSPHTETDWTNWKDVQRITAGLGYRFNDKCYLDIAYQYHMQKGDFYAFNGYVNDDIVIGQDIFFPPTEISANRSRLNLTFGVKF